MSYDVLAETKKFQVAKRAVDSVSGFKDNEVSDVVQT